MKLFITLLIALFSLIVQGQIVGVNGQGYFENITPQADIWFKDAVKNDTFALRVPGGAIAKFAAPAPDKGGWGLEYAIIDSIQIAYGSDEEESTQGAIDKWHRKADAQPSFSYLDELINMQVEYPAMQVIWVANIFIPAQITTQAIDYLLNNNVNVVLIELGNETYSQVDYDFIKYITKATPIMQYAALKNIPVAHPVAALNRRETGTHTRWANSLQSYNNYIIFHPYYDEREWSGLNKPVDTALATSQIASYDFNTEFQNLKNRFPNATGFGITEGNIQPSNLVGDTPLNAFFMQRFLIAGKESFNYFCIHNGVAPDKYGIIYGTKTQKRNTTYYPFAAMFKEVIKEENKCDTIVSYYTTYDTSYFNYTSIDTTIEQVIKYDTLTNGYTITDTLLTMHQDTTYQTSFDSIIIYAKRNDKPKMYFKSNVISVQKIESIIDTSFTYSTVVDTAIISRIVYDTLFKNVSYIDTIIKSTVHQKTEINCDTLIPLPDPIGFQKLDADTLIFNNETEFRDFLFHYNLASNYEVKPQKFDASIAIEDAIPFVQMKNNAGVMEWVPDPNYFRIYRNGAEVSSSSGYLNEELFAGKRFVLIFDHSGIVKTYREFYLKYCPDGDWLTTDVELYNVEKKQRVIFKNGITWSDRNGENIMNNNLKAWQLWGKDLPEKNYDFIPNLPDSTSGCDLSFKEFNPGHETATLRFMSMSLMYGYLRK